MEPDLHLSHPKSEIVELVQVVSCYARQSPTSSPLVALWLLAVPVLASTQEAVPPEGAMLIILDAPGSYVPETHGVNFLAGSGLWIRPDGKDMIAILATDHYDSCGSKKVNGKSRWAVSDNWR
jgi:hypothetical protein